jgi:hypothetical protein
MRQQANLSEVVALIREAPFGPQGWKFWLVLLLGMVNWGLEARKWQLLMRLLEPMSYSRAVKSVLSGVSVSLNTPNRIGEYGGRILFVNEGHRIKAVSLSIASGIAQLIVTLAMGCGGLLYLLQLLDPERGSILGLSAFWIKILLYLSSCALVILLLFFFRLGWLVRLIEKLPYTTRFIQYISVLDAFNAKVLLRLLFISTMRYLIFVLQYILLMQVMRLGLNVWQSLWMVATMFWMLAIIPSFAITELPIRGKIGQSLFSLFSTNALGIIAVTFGIWFINLFVPAIIGSLLILGNKIVRDK